MYFGWILVKTVFFQILILSLGCLRAACSPLVKLLVCLFLSTSFAMHICQGVSCVQTLRTVLHFTVAFECRWRDEQVSAHDNGVHAGSGCIPVIASNCNKSHSRRTKWIRKDTFWRLQRSKTTWSKEKDLPSGPRWVNISRKSVQHKHWDFIFYCLISNSESPIA